MKRRAVPARQILPMAMGLCAARRYSDVAELCAQILEQQPDQFHALYLSGLDAYRMGDKRSARSRIEKAIRIWPDIARFQHMTGGLRQKGKETWFAVRQTALMECYKFSFVRGFIISYPKCGRTWVRFMLGRYLLQGREGDPLEVQSITGADPNLLNIAVSHDDYPQSKPYTDIHTDKSIYHDKAVVLLVRDPRDLLVSRYFYYRKRGGKESAKDAAYCGTLSDYIRNDIGGLFSVVRFYNVWARNRDVPQSFHLMRYEEIRADTPGEFSRLIAFFDLPDFGRDAVDDAVSFASFDNMRRLEETNALDNPMLQPRSGGDLERFKVRRGMVGGYRDYLTDDDIAFIDDYLMTELDDFYADYKKPSRK